MASTWIEKSHGSHLDPPVPQVDSLINVQIALQEDDFTKALGSSGNVSVGFPSEAGESERAGKSVDPTLTSIHENVVNTTLGPCEAAASVLLPVESEQADEMTHGINIACQKDIGADECDKVTSTRAEDACKSLEPTLAHIHSMYESDGIYHMKQSAGGSSEPFLLVAAQDGRDIDSPQVDAGDTETQREAIFSHLFIETDADKIPRVASPIDETNQMSASGDDDRSQAMDLEDISRSIHWNTSEVEHIPGVRLNLLPQDLSKSDGSSHLQQKDEDKAFGIQTSELPKAFTKLDSDVGAYLPGEKVQFPARQLNESSEDRPRTPEMDATGTASPHELETSEVHKGELEENPVENSWDSSIVIDDSNEEIESEVVESDVNFDNEMDVDSNSDDTLDVEVDTENQQSRSRSPEQYYEMVNWTSKHYAEESIAVFHLPWKEACEHWSKVNRLHRLQNTIAFKSFRQKMRKAYKHAETSGQLPDNEGRKLCCWWKEHEEALVSELTIDKNKATVCRFSKALEQLQETEAKKESVTISIGDGDEKDTNYVPARGWRR